VLLTRLQRASAAPAELERRLPLSLSAEQRTRLRGHCRSDCGQDLLLQLPRGTPLQPGERLLSADGRVLVEVLAAPEQLLRVSAAQPLALLQAAYHLGNRHVALELHPDHLLLPFDSVLLDLLRHRGLQVETVDAPFAPESGAYGGHDAHAHPHAHGHHHQH